MNCTKTKTCQGVVYRWVNSYNRKWYIGSHEGSCSDGYLASGKLIMKSFKKYGITNFTREVLYRGEYFRELEEFILETLDAASDPTSYNLKNQAIGGDVWRGRKHTEEYQEHLRKLSQPGERNGMYGKAHTEESRELIRQKKLGGIPWNKGKTGIYTQETLNKRNKSREGFEHSTKTREAMSRQRVGSLNSNAKQININGTTYGTLQEASNALGISLYMLHKLYSIPRL